MGRSPSNRLAESASSATTVFLLAALLGAAAVVVATGAGHGEEVVVGEIAVGGSALAPTWVH